MRKRLLAAIAVLGLAAAAIATFALAHGGDGKLIHACVDDKRGDVRLVAPTQDCVSGEQAVDWSITGPAGTAGAQGATGPQGPKGDTGPAGSGGSSEPSAVKVGTVEIIGKDGVPIVEAGTQILSFSSELISPRDAASGLPTGKRQHKPFIIRKSLDKASPLLFKALVTNETLPEVKIGLVKRGASAGSVPYMTIVLTNASVASRTASDNGKHDTHELEEISFTFQKISWTWVDGGITAEDDWNAPVA